MGKKTAGALVLAAAALVLGVGTAAAAEDAGRQGTRVTGVENREIGVPAGTDGTRVTGKEQ